jgi:hypothetical protein
MTKPHWPVTNASKVLYFLAENEGRWCTWGTSFNCPTVQSCLPIGMNEDEQLKFMQDLQKKGLVSGCDCGCRGDYTVTPEGLDFLAAECVAGEYKAEEYREKDDEFGYGY